MHHSITVIFIVPVGPATHQSEKSSPLKTNPVGVTYFLVKWSIYKGFKRNKTPRQMLLTTSYVVNRSGLWTCPDNSRLFAYIRFVAYRSIGYRQTVLNFLLYFISNKQFNHSSTLKVTWSKRMSLSTIFVTQTLNLALDRHLYQRSSGRSMHLQMPNIGSFTTRQLAHSDRSVTGHSVNVSFPALASRDSLRTSRRHTISVRCVAAKYTHKTETLQLSAKGID